MKEKTNIIVNCTRLQKSSIKSMDWFSEVLKFDKYYMITTYHEHRDNSIVYDRHERIVNEKQVTKFLDKNSEFIIEIYSRQIDPIGDCMFYQFLKYKIARTPEMETK